MVNGNVVDTLEKTELLVNIPDLLLGNHKLCHLPKDFPRSYGSSLSSKHLYHLEKLTKLHKENCYITALLIVNYYKDKASRKISPKTQ